jgi:cell pole-organizing protein PopZ
MAEASAPKGAAGEDPSMEEILQSIRAIIAEDGDETKPSDAPKPNNPAGQVTGSDVLELTDSMAADTPPPPAAKVETPPPAPVMEAPATPPPAAAPAAPADVLSQIEDALSTPAAAPAAAAPAAVSPAVAAVTSEALLSEQAAATAAASVKKLQAAVEPPLPGATTTPSPAFQSGNTIEGMAAAMLKPMIKEWLDKNLPGIVERIVTAEIRRLSK